MNIERFKQLLESTMGNVKPLIDEREDLMEQTTQGVELNIEKYVTPFIAAVQNVFPEYKGQKIEKNTQGATLFGQYLYTLPLTMPNDKQKVISNLNKIYGLVIGKGVSGKETQSMCIPKITNTVDFKEGHGCYAFQTQNKVNFPKYATMNASFNNLTNYINSINEPTQK